MNDTPFGWAFIGAGTLARQVAVDILGDGRHKIVTVYNRTNERGEAYAATVGARFCDTIEASVLADGVEGVYINTVNTAHYEHAMQALSLGKPVLLEKPFTVNSDDALTLIDTAKTKGVYLAEAMWTWFPGAAVDVRGWLAGGAIGALKSAHFRYQAPHNPLPRLNDPNVAGGALLDIGVYPITYCVALFGAPLDVSCDGVLQGGVDIRETLRLHYRDFTAVCEISIEHDGLHWDGRIVGEKGEIYSDRLPCATDAVLTQNGKVQTAHYDGGYIREFDAVAKEIRAGNTESAFAPFERTLTVMKIMDECRAKMGLRYPFELLLRTINLAMNDAVILS